MVFEKLYDKYKDTPEFYGRQQHFEYWCHVKVLPEYIKELPEGTHIIEIGAMYGQDSDYLSKCFGIPDERVHCIEASSRQFAELCRLNPGFHNSKYLVSSKKYDDFYVLNPIKHAGASSALLRTANYERIEHPENIRMEDYIKGMGLENTPLLVLIDVEGLDQEVFDSFGEYHKNIEWFCSELPIKTDKFDLIYQFCEAGWFYLYKRKGG